ALETGNQVHVAATRELPAALLKGVLIPEVWSTAREAHMPLPQKIIRPSVGRESFWIPREKRWPAASLCETRAVRIEKSSFHDCLYSVDSQAHYIGTDKIGLEDPGSIPNTDMVAHNCNSSSRGSDNLFCPLQISQVSAQTCQPLLCAATVSYCNHPSLSSSSPSPVP
ncbi:hypothetical protein STEG23_007040, partial [Scotinomys teguina]